MNEEEKKAVGLLKALNNLEKKCKIEKVPYKSEIKKIRISLLPEDYGIFEILLNLIEKLQKENEELKLKERRRIIGKYGEFEIHNVINRTLSNDYIPVQKVKDKIKEILKNGEYRIIFEGDAEFPDEATIITTKYLKLEKVQKLQRENERLRKQNKIMCDEYCPQIQKIKAKIEELDIAILECEYSDDDNEEYKKEVEKDKLELLKQKRVLQELLKKEDSKNG